MFKPSPLSLPIIAELLAIIRSPQTSKVVSQRASVIFYLYSHPDLLCPTSVAELMEVTPQTARKYLRRFEDSVEALEFLCQQKNKSQFARTLRECFEDAPRSGRGPQLSPGQIVSIISLACEKPELSGRPISKWTRREIADEAIKRGIVPSISPSHVGNIIRSVNLRPDRVKGWCFTTEKDEQLFQAQVEAVCDTYLSACENYQQEGVHTVSVDECTGIQANEKCAPTLSPKPEKAGKEETQYTRHGSLCLLAAWHVVLGQVIYHLAQETRNNQDFADFITNMVDFDPTGKWVIILDNLNIHCSEELVRLIAKAEGIDESTLGSKKKRQGILGSQKSRKEFLSDPTHRIRFVFTPKHSSWLNQIEVIFGIIKRRALQGASFKSKKELILRLNEFIPYFNQNFAKPMNWTYTGRPTDAKVEIKPQIWREKIKRKTWKHYWQQQENLLAT